MQKPKAKELRKGKIMALLVNGERIEDSAIQKEVERLRPEYEETFAWMDPAEREAQLHDWAKENIIERTLLHQEVKKDGIIIPKAEIEEFFARLKENLKDDREFFKDIGIEDDEQLKQFIERVLQAEQKYDQICKDLPKPSQTDIQQYYEENKEQFEHDEQIRVAHIVKYIDWQTDEKTAYNAIKQASDEMEKGVLFEAVANRYTDCKESGDPVYIIRDEMAEEFNDVVFNLGKGEVSDIFRTRFGFHIAKVYDRKPAVVPKLEEVKSEIKAILKKQMREKAIEDFIDQLKSNAKIEEI